MDEIRLSSSDISHVKRETKEYPGFNYIEGGLIMNEPKPINFNDDKPENLKPVYLVLRTKEYEYASKRAEELGMWNGSATEYIHDLIQRDMINFSEKK